MPRSRWLVAGAALMLALPGCGSSPTKASPTAPAASAPASSTEPSSGDPSDKPPVFPADTKPQTAKKRGAWDLVLTDVRVAEHPGFDRIVLEFEGRGIPGWWVGYVDKPALEGSGRVVRLGGDASLNIGAVGTTWPSPDYYTGPRRLGLSEGGGISGVYVGGTFEGYTQVLVGVDSGRAPFRVFAITGPSRLVVDVVDDVG